MPKPAAIAWTAEMDSWLGKEPDAKVATRFGIQEQSVRYRRVRQQVPTFRSSRGPVTLPCANCGTAIPRKRRDLDRSQKLYCSHQCSSAGQKRRDTDTLRYGPGWKNTRAKVRQRDKVCAVCKTPPRKTALHIHHLKPYRYGGTNLLPNLVSLCDSCHHTVEAITTATLAAIQIDVTLGGSVLTIKVDGEQRWRGSVRGADSPTPIGSAA